MLKVVASLATWPKGPVGRLRRGVAEWRSEWHLQRWAATGDPLTLISSPPQLADSVGDWRAETDHAFCCKDASER
jgi:hypothetical protein